MSGLLLLWAVTPVVVLLAVLLYLHIVAAKFEAAPLPASLLASAVIWSMSTCPLFAAAGQRRIGVDGFVVGAADTVTVTTRPGIDDPPGRAVDRRVAMQAAAARDQLAAALTAAGWHCTTATMDGALPCIEVDLTRPALGLPTRIVMAPASATDSPPVVDDGLEQLWLLSEEA